MYRSCFRFGHSKPRFSGHFQSPERPPWDPVAQAAVRPVVIVLLDTFLDVSHFCPESYLSSLSSFSGEHYKPAPVT